MVEPRITKQLIDHYASGGSHLHPESPASPVDDDPSYPLDPLSPRELEVFACVVAGLSNGEICETLHLSPATVKTHVNRIFAKLHVRDRVHAVILGHELKRRR